MIIGINGYSGSGKDTMGRLIEEMYPTEKWQIKKFAGKLKEIARILTGIDEEQFENQQFKKTNLGREWWTTCDEGWQPMTVRDFLQKLGTDGLRNGLHPNVWVNALMSEYVRPVDLSTYQYAKEYTDSRKRKKGDTFPLSDVIDYKKEVKFPNWVITDTRFPNEADAIKEKGGIVVRIERTGVAPINTHPSETGLDGWAFDYVINNSSDIEHLKSQITNIFKHIF
jgi:hypothetical protein